VPGITDEMRRVHGARVVDLRRGRDGESVHGAIATDRWVLTVAFPLVNLGDSLAMLLTTAIGNDPSTSIAMRLVDLVVPAAFARMFPGPRFGVRGWRDATGVEGRPLLLNMIKPCTGFPPEVGAGFAVESARGGVDLIKDDELLADPSFSRVVERTRAYVAAIDAVAAETGRRTRYVAHVTSRPSRLLAIARAAVDNGAAGVMVTPLTLGLDALAELADAVDVPILAHVAGVETFTGAIEGGIGHGALATLLRLAGADAVLTSSPHAPRPLPDDAYRATLDALRAPLAGDQVTSAMPMIGGGIAAEHVGAIVDAAGTDVIVAAGGSIQGHPDGPAAGGRAMQAAIRAAADRAALAEPGARRRDGGA
jgi:2,3-diketo-5-methylthiopentyl-1-phosphate enolase